MIVSERLCLGHPFLKHHAVRESSGGDRVLWGKLCNLYRVYKLIMVNHVLGYGHLEYLEVDINVDLVTL